MIENHIGVLVIRDTNMALVLKWMPVRGLLLQSNQVSLCIKYDIQRTNKYKVTKSKHCTLTGTTDQYEPALITLFRLFSNMSIIYFNLFISNSMAWGILVIKWPRNPRQVCRIPEGEAGGNPANLPRVKGHLITNFPKSHAITYNKHIKLKKNYNIAVYTVF